LIFDQSLLFDEPGSRFAYSNSGIVILGAVIEKVTGMPYPVYLYEHIFKPLGMTDTKINFAEEIVENRSTGYIKLPNGKFTSNIFMVPPANADGGIETTVLDMLKFDQALYSNDLVNERYKKKMFTPNLNEYGYCWRISTVHGHKVIGHSGGAPGINAVFSRYVEDGYTLIVMSNYDMGASPIARTLEAVLLGAQYEMPRPRVEEFILSAMKEHGLKKLEAEWDALLKQHHYELRNSSILNNIGYSLVNSGMMEEAILVFRQNVRLFPDEANPYDSLAEAYLNTGEREKAITTYKKALEIDPEFQNAKAALERLAK